MIDKLRTVLEKKLPPGSFIRNVVTLMTGTTFAQALLIFAAPILTRLYSPEDFGIYALYTSILGVLAVVSCWRYELAIVLPEKDEDAANLLVLSICICFCMAVLTLILVSLFRNPVANLLGAPKLAPWLWLLPLSIVATGLFQAFNYWSTRRKKFRRLAVRQITQSTITAATQLGTGVALHPGPGGLISGSIIGQLAATVRLAWQVFKEEGRQIVATTNKHHIQEMLILHKKFPLLDSWSGLLNTVSAMLPVLLLGYFFNPAIVGFYALGQKVLSLPMGIIGSSLAQVFYPRAISAARDGDLAQIVMRAFQELIKVSLVPMVLLIIVAPQLFSFFFGSQWLISGEYVKWLGIWFLFTFISSPISTIFFVLNRQGNLLIINILLFFTRICSLLWAGWLQDDLLAIKLLGFSGGAVYLILCIWVLKISGNKIDQVIKQVLILIFSAIPYIIAPLISIWISTSEVTLIVALLCGFVYMCRLAKNQQSWLLQDKK